MPRRRLVVSSGVTATASTPNAIAVSDGGGREESVHADLGEGARHEVFHDPTQHDVAGADPRCGAEQSREDALDHAHPQDRSDGHAVGEHRGVLPGALVDRDARRVEGDEQGQGQDGALRTTVAHYAAAAQFDDAVSHAGDLPVVGDHEHRLARGGLGLEQLEDLYSGLEVELPVGSSASRIGFPVASARAMATRCCSPPDS